MLLASVAALASVLHVKYDALHVYVAPASARETRPVTLLLRRAEAPPSFCGDGGKSKKLTHADAGLTLPLVLLSAWPSRRRLLRVTVPELAVTVKLRT
jgi:hypothetical protein